MKTTPSWVPSASLLAIVALLAIGAYVAQGWLGLKTTDREIVLFNILQFVFTVSAGWIVSRMFSRHEFEESLKRFAISAYRRVFDIGESVRMLEREVKRMRDRYEEGTHHELDQIGATIQLLTQTIESSKSDWGDVLGEELDKLQELETLRARVLELEGLSQFRDSRPEKETGEDAGDRISAQVRELQKQIEKLKRTLPAKLRVRDLSGKTPRDAAERIARLYASPTGLLLKARWDPRKRGDKAPTGRIKEGARVKVRLSGGVNVEDDNDVFLGRVLNRLIVNKIGYVAFESGLMLAFASDELDGQIVNVEPIEETARVVFTVKITSSLAWPPEES